MTLLAIASALSALSAAFLLLARHLRGRGSLPGDLMAVTGLSVLCGIYAGYAWVAVLGEVMFR